MNRYDTDQNQAWTFARRGKIDFKPSNWNPWPECYSRQKWIHEEFFSSLLKLYIPLVNGPQYSCCILEKMPSLLVCGIAAALLIGSQVVPDICVLVATSAYFSSGPDRDLPSYVKSASLSERPSTSPDLQSSVGSFPLQYPNGINCATKRSSAILFKSQPRVTMLILEIAAWTQTSKTYLNVSDSRIHKRKQQADHDNRKSRYGLFTIHLIMYWIGWNTALTENLWTSDRRGVFTFLTLISSRFWLSVLCRWQ